MRSFVVTLFAVFVLFIGSAVLAVSVLIAPVAAQDDAAAAENDIQEGVDLLSEGARKLLRGLMGEVEPAMRDMADAVRDWNFKGLGIEDLGQYHPPEILPNGDIIIRRKERLEAPRDDPMDGEIEL